MIGRGAGSVQSVRGGVAVVRMPFARVGDGVRICARDRIVAARIAALDGTRAVVAPFGTLHGVGEGDRVESDPAVLALPFGTPLLGRAVDAAGTPLDGRPAPRGGLRRDPPAAPVGTREVPRDVFWTGVRAIDGPLALARGARVGIFGPPGAGKSSLLEAIARGAGADAVVVALVGERGREAERHLARIGPHTTIVCATADRSAAERVRAAEVALAQAVALRERGLDVLLILDSLARVCAAARERALAAGEPAGRGGFPPSVFGLLARLVERAGAFRRGSITMLATVLSEGPDEHDPVSEAARAVLDGHLVLSARLAGAGRFPAIDVPRSASRTLADAASPAHVAAARVVRAAAAALEDVRDLRAAGVTPADPFAARCIVHEARLDAFLRQGPEPSSPDATLTALTQLADVLS